MKIGEVSLGVKDVDQIESKEDIGLENSAANILILDESPDKLGSTPNKRLNIFDNDESPVHNTHENTQNNLVIFADEVPEDRPRTNKRVRSQKLETIKSEPKEEGVQSIVYQNK